MFLKSVLLIPMLLGLSAAAAVGVIMLVQGADPLAWAGVVLAAIPLPAFVGIAMATKSIARTSPRLPVLLLASLAGLGMALAATLADPSIGTEAVLLAGLAAICFVWYDFRYSRFDRRPSRVLKLGGDLPDFPIFNRNGQRISSHAFLGKPALFLFYRGNWCPLCMAQIREIATQYRRLTDLGIETVLISPQPHDQTEHLAHKFDIPFHFMVDRNGEAAKALQIEAANGVPLGLDAMGYGRDTVMPTVVAVDAHGIVIFLDQTDNYRVRPEPDTFIKIFECCPKRLSAEENHVPESTTARAA